MPEVSPGIPQQHSPHSYAAQKQHMRGQALTVAELCEREFCGTLRSTFLGERRLSSQDSLATEVILGEGIGALAGNIIRDENGNTGIIRRRRRSSDDQDDAEGRGIRDEISRRSSPQRRGQALDMYIEIMDYIGGNEFHGFIAQHGAERGMFIFLDQSLRHQDLKAGLTAILELASEKSMDITQVVACVDRAIPEKELSALTHDLGWVGFEMATLAPWTEDPRLLTSEEWLLLSVEV